MANPQDLQVKLTVDASGVAAGVNQAQEKLKGFGEAAKTQTESVHTLKGAVGELGKAFGELFAAAEIINILKESAQAAVENQKSYAILANQLHNTTGATKEQSAAIDAQLEKMSEMSATKMPELRTAYGYLIRATGSATEALKLQPEALDLAASAHVSVTVAAKALGKAYDGQMGALDRLMPSVKGAKDPLDAVAKATKGAAEAAANTDPIAKMQVMWEHIEVTLGNALMPILNQFVGLLDSVMPIVSQVAELLGKLVNAFMPLINQVLKAIMPLFGSLIGLILKIVDAVLPPLTMIISRVLVPVLNILVGYLTNFVIPIFGRLIDALAPVYRFIYDQLTKAFQWLLNSVLKPVYAFLKPMIDGLMSLLGIKPINIKVTTSLDSSGVDAATSLAGLKTTSVPGGGGGSTGGSKSGSSSTSAKADTALVAYLKNTQSQILAARKTYDDAVKAANDKYGALIQKYADEMQSIIQASMDRLRSAFASATATDVGKMFSDLNKAGTASADDLLASLKTRLDSIKTLATNAATLSGLGFSQTFIEQIVAQGPDAGNAMADALKSATPETQKQLQDLFRQTEVVSSTGMDALAQQIYDKTGLATDAMKAQYQTASDNMKQAQDDLASALSTAANTLNDSLTTIGDNLTAYLLKSKADISKYSDDILALFDKIDAAKSGAMAAPVYSSTTGLTTSGNASAPGSFMNTVGYNSGQTVVVNATTNATPQAIADTAVLALKYGVPLSKLTA